MVKLLSSLPVGTKVSLGIKYYGKDVTFLLADKKTENVLITEKIITIKAFDGKEASNSNSDRRSYGNNRYTYSNILSWLNSDATNWYEPKHGADAPPNASNVTYNPYDGEAGFLTHIPSDIKSAIKTTAQRTVKPSVDGGGSEIVNSKVYLPSLTEVGLPDEGGVAEGVKWELFSDNTSRIAYPTAEAVTNSTYKTTDLSTSKGWYYWLRSPSASNAGSVRCVNHVGSRYYLNALGGHVGVLPALNLPSDILVSDNPNSDGVYTLELNAAPDITSPQPENIGDKNEPFTVNYTVNDADGDTVKVTEKLNDTTLRTIDSVPLGQQQTITLTWEQWQSLPSDEVSTIEVSASDGQETTVKRFTFTKRNNRPMVTLGVKDNETYYEGSTLNISGTATDADVGDAVIVKYKLASSRERVITTQVSTGESFDYGKVLTFTKGRFFDGETVVTDVLAEGNTYTLEVWAQDDKGATSLIQKRKFTVVPNRSPLLEITETPSVEGAALSTDLSIKGTVNDPDGDDVRLTYKLNNGKEIPIAESGGMFEVDFKLSDLKQGRNTFLVIARDEYDAMTTREVQVTTAAVKSSTDHIKNKLYYTIDTKGVETDGILVWLRRPIGDDTDYKGYLSITQTGAVEDYQAMDKTTSIVQGHNRDELIGSVGEKGADVRLKLEFDGNEAPIEMLQGVIK